MSELLQRLRERKLVQWALAYSAGAFALLQGLDIVAQQFGWGDAVRRGITIALVIGFLVTLVLAWYHGERGEQRVSGTELLIVALLLIIGGGLLWRFAPHSGEPANPATAQAAKPVPASVQAASDKSIAVLPFANLSDEKANAYFADGIQDEILTKLSKIGALRVISRTSTQRYASAPENLAEIARQLGVANILEGSVQKAGNAVHINVQLIGAAKDEHLWAESYNRTLDDIFGVEGEVAQAIADALKATLTGAEQKSVAAKATDSPAAYEAYLRGRAFMDTGYGLSSEIHAINSFGEATRLDPKFALAWAYLATIMSNQYFNGANPQQATATAVQLAAQTALDLQPELGEALLAHGNYRYHVERDYAGAREEFRRALEKLPNQPEALAALYFVERRMGRWDEAVALMRRAIARDPANVNQLGALGCDGLLFLRRLDEARDMLKHALELSADNADTLGCLAQVELNEGRLDAADAWLARTPPATNDYYQVFARETQLAYERKFAEMIQWLRPALPESDAALSGADMSSLIAIGYAQKWSGKAADAKQTFERTLRAIQATPGGVDHITSAGPNVLAMAYEGLGDHAHAVSEARHQVELRAYDSIESAAAQLTLAQVYAQHGDRDAAIALLPRLLEIVAGLTPAMLALDPVWDPIRADPRFVAMTKLPIHQYATAPQ